MLTANIYTHYSHIPEEVSKRLYKLNLGEMGYMHEFLCRFMQGEAYRVCTLNCSGKIVSWAIEKLHTKVNEPNLCVFTDKLERNQGYGKLVVETLISTTTNEHFCIGRDTEKRSVFWEKVFHNVAMNRNSSLN